MIPIHLLADAHQRMPSVTELKLLVVLTAGYVGDILELMIETYHQTFVEIAERLSAIESRSSACE